MTAEPERGVPDAGLGAEHRPSRTPPPAGEPSLANMANAFTMLRVALVPVIGVLVFVGGGVARWWALGLFVFAAITDTLDGWVARRRFGVTRWGQLADPAADKLLVLGTAGLLALEGTFPWWAVAVIAFREIAVTIQRQALARRSVVMPASPFGKVKTVSQLVMVSLYLAPATPSAILLLGLWTAVVLTVASGVDYAIRGWRPGRAD